jgi:hypothetical protein
MDGPICEHMVTFVATEEEEKTKEMHLLPTYPARKNELMASSSDTDKKILKLWRNFKIPHQKYLRTLKQRSIVSYFKNQ